MDGVGYESAIMALLALSRRCLSDDPLSEQGVNATVDGRAMRLDVSYIHID
jgi:hypothetical protein